MNKLVKQILLILLNDLPGIRPGLVLFQGGMLPDKGSPPVQIRYFFHGDRLDEHIPDGSCLHRTSYHRFIANIRNELVQIIGLAAASYHMNYIEPPAG